MDEHLFEGVTPLVARLEESGPYASAAEMLSRARELVRELTEDEKIAVINAHPRIGERPDALKERSATSYREQGYESRTASDDVLAQLDRLNAQYEARFGFRFVVFVNWRSHAALVPVLQERLQRAREQEIETALGEILAIAEDRMKRAH